jgi:hypothetical protein
LAFYISVPRDLSRVKTKILFGLTKRQLICFAVAAVIGIPAYFLMRKTGNNSLAALGMIIIMLPMFFLAMYEKNGEPLEVLIGHIIQYAIVRPKTRPYITNNYYSVLERISGANKEAEQIVRKAEKRKSGKKKVQHSAGPDKGREKGAGKDNREGKRG